MVDATSHVTDPGAECAPGYLGRALQRAFSCLAANETGHEQRVNIAYKLLDLFRDTKSVVEGALQEVGLQEHGILEKLLISISQLEGTESIDLFAIFFCYCSVYRPLQKHVVEFLKFVSAGDGRLNMLLNKMCELQGEDDAGHYPGIYTITFQLEMFDTIDTELVQYLDLKLGPVLKNCWIPSWERWIQSDVEYSKLSLKQIMVKDDLLLKCVHEYEMDIMICNLQHLIPKLEILLLDDDSSVEYFMFKISKRSLKFSKWLNDEFSAIIRHCYTKTGKNKSFETLYEDETFQFQVIMELIDHPGLNLLKESHLMLLLRVSLDHFWSQCTDIENISTVHNLLGKLGTTQSLPSLLNLLQYSLTRYLLTVVECIINGIDMESDSKWYKKLTEICIPNWFEELRPKIPPISKSLFGFVNNTTELKQEAENYQDNLINILESLELVLSLNGHILKFYQHAGLDPLNLEFETISENTTSIQNKTNSIYLNLYFVPLISALLFSEHLSQRDNQIILVSRPVCSTSSKIIFRHCIQEFEHLLQNHGNVALYHLIKFLSQVSVEGLSLQRQSIKILNHLFFHGDQDLVLQLCLANELSTQSLYDYIQLWNDGSPKYTLFFTRLFKKSQPLIQTKTMVFRDLLDLLPDFDHPSISVSPSIPKTKFNTNAISFVPHDNVTINTPRRSDYSNQYSITASPSAYSLNSASIRANSTASSTLNTPLTDAYPAFFNNNSSINANANPIRPQLLQNWSSSSPSVPIQSAPQIVSTKLVNTGKSYILGGHNRAINNSRTKSVHVDDFERI